MSALERFRLRVQEELLRQPRRRRERATHDPEWLSNELASLGAGPTQVGR
jgi:hypothetical protein